MVASGSAGSSVSGAGLQFGGHAGGDDVASILYDDSLNSNNGGFDLNVDGTTFLSLHEAAILPAFRERVDGKTRRTRASKKGHNEYAALRRKREEVPEEQ